jgi:hypothetical protein
MATKKGHGRLKINVGIDVANNVELRANAQYIHATTRVARPKNTTLAYKPKQREFQVRVYRIDLGN